MLINIRYQPLFQQEDHHNSVNGVFKHFNREKYAAKVHINHIFWKICNVKFVKLQLSEAP